MPAEPFLTLAWPRLSLWCPWRPHGSLCTCISRYTSLTSLPICSLCRCTRDIFHCL